MPISVIDSTGLASPLTGLNNPTVVGNMTFSTSGSGVIFTNTTSGVLTNSTLTDYETGTWTPAFQTGTFTYSRQTGYYTKIGNVVNASVDLLWASNSGGGVNISINIPFVIGGTSNSRAVGSFGFVLGMSFTSGTVPEISGNGTASNVNIYAMQPGGTTPTTLLNSALSSSGELQFSITYIASF